MLCNHCGCDITGGMTETCPECGGRVSPPRGLFRVISWVEDAAISFMLLSMILIVLVQIFLRNFYSTGVSGGAEIVRHLVLWVAFLGAGIAARERKHIKIDIAQRMLSYRLRHLSEVVTDLFATVVCGILLYASIQFVISDYGTGTTIAFFDLPIWMLELVIPLGYLAVTVRYSLYTLESLVKLVKGE